MIMGHIKVCTPKEEVNCPKKRARAVVQHTLTSFGLPNASTNNRNENITKPEKTYMISFAANLKIDFLPGFCKKKMIIDDLEPLQVYILLISLLHSRRNNKVVTET